MPETFPTSFDFLSMISISRIAQWPIKENGKTESLSCMMSSNHDRKPTIVRVIVLNGELSEQVLEGFGCDRIASADLCNVILKIEFRYLVKEGTRDLFAYPLEWAELVKPIGGPWRVRAPSDHDIAPKWEEIDPGIFLEIFLDRNSLRESCVIVQAPSPGLDSGKALTEIECWEVPVEFLERALAVVAGININDTIEGA